MGPLQGLSFRNVQGTYFWSLEETQMASWVGKLTNMVTSDQPYELHKWLTGAPAMTKWTGSRTRQTLTDYSLNVVNDKWESTLEFDIDDVRRDKTGQIMRRVAELGQKAATLPQRVFSTLLNANGKAYDGVAFFADSHTVGGSTIDNSISTAAATGVLPTVAEMVQSILDQLQSLWSFKDDKGDPCNEFAKQFMLMVPPQYAAAAIGALNNEFQAASTSNTLVKAGLVIDLAVNPRLTGNFTYLFRTDAPVKPFIWQEETIADGFKTLGPESDNGFFKDQIAVGAKRIGQGALGRFELAVRNEFT